MRKLMFFLVGVWIVGCIAMIYIIDYNETLNTNYEWLEKYGIDFSKAINIGYKLHLDKILPLDKINKTTLFLADLNLTGQKAVNLLAQGLLYGALAMLLFFILEPIIKRAIIFAIIIGLGCIFLLEYIQKLGIIENFEWVNFVFSSTFFSVFAILGTLFSKVKRY